MQVHFLKFAIEIAYKYFMSNCCWLNLTCSHDMISINDCHQDDFENCKNLVYA